MGGLCYDWVTYMKEDELGGANRDWEKTGELLSSAAGDGRTIFAGCHDNVIEGAHESSDGMDGGC